MLTFSIQTLGCKVNQYESEQVAVLLRRRGLRQVGSDQPADLRIINTCSVTVQAASKSRQTVRRSTRLPVLQTAAVMPLSSAVTSGSRSRVIVTGCWATSDPGEAGGIAGVDAVLGHHDDVAAELDRLLDLWGLETTSDASGVPSSTPTSSCAEPHLPEPFRYDGWMNLAGTPAARLPASSKPNYTGGVNKNPSRDSYRRVAGTGTLHLPLLDTRQRGHQRAYLKIQDGCDAHCTYCIIPRLRPTLWSKPIGQVVDEARRLVDSGHLELVLTGIFLSAYGRNTALRRRQEPTRDAPLANLVEALCTQVQGLRRLRFSSLEPGDLTPSLISALRAYPQVVPHFHLPLQSGSDSILRRMNRQYSRYDFLRMIEQLNAAFDRPAITTDIIVGFPGETDDHFQQTLEVVDRAGFIHVHAFSFSPRPGTAAARWSDDFVRGPVVNQRIDQLARRADRNSLDFRCHFLGQMVELLVEAPGPDDPLPHGRCERYFEVWFDDPSARPGDAVRVEVERVTPQRTFGRAIAGKAGAA